MNFFCFDHRAAAPALHKPRDATRQKQGLGLAVSTLSSYANGFLHSAIATHDHAELAARPAPENAIAHTFGVQLVGGVICVDKVDDLVRRHAGGGVASFQAQLVFLLLAPGVDVLEILGVDVDESVEEVGDFIVQAQHVVDVEEVLEAVLEEGAVRGDPLGLDLFRLQVSEADAPALEDNGLYGRLAGLVYGFPLGLWEAIALAGEGGLVVERQLDGLAVEQGGEDADGQGHIMCACRFPRS